MAFAVAHVLQQGDPDGDRGHAGADRGRRRNTIGTGGGDTRGGVHRPETRRAPDRKHGLGTVVPASPPVEARHHSAAFGATAQLPSRPPGPPLAADGRRPFRRLPWSTPATPPGSSPAPRSCC